MHISLHTFTYGLKKAREREREGAQELYSQVDLIRCIDSWYISTPYNIECNE